MTRPLTHPGLEACGVAHGFGVRGAPVPAGLRRPRQVHGATIVAANACAAAEAPEADGVVSALPGASVGVVTADCVPILLATGCGTVVAAVHAGWRGLARGVVAAAVEALRGAASPDAAPVAVIGPHIGPCCYEVDDPVLAALAERFDRRLDDALRPSRPGHSMLDLGALARAALLGTGVARENVSAIADSCTHCHPQRFHSYRRDGPRAGRLVHFVAARRLEA